MTLYLYDDAAARAFEPFSLTRPAGELRAGAEIIRHRWERRLQRQARGFVGAEHLADFDEPGAPPAVCHDADLEPGAIVASSRFIPSLAGAADAGARAWTAGGKLAAVRLSAPLHAADLASGSLTLEEIAARDGSSKAKAQNAMTPSTGAGIVDIAGRWIEHVWDLIGTLKVQLTEDIEALVPDLTIRNDPGLHVIGDHGVFCEHGAVVEPYVVLDASAGPILIRRGATVSAFTRIVGPCYVGEDAAVLGEQIGVCSIGDVCKVRGEISNSIFLGHSNKGHAGFLGHSYLGRWVNLGAGTTTSNLKNTYGTVVLRTEGGDVETGQQFLGTLFGDHAKTAIGTMLTTGTIVGAGANVFGGTMAPKRVQPFAWGSDGERVYEAEKFLEVAARMMARRHVELTERGRRVLRAAYDIARSKRQ